MVLFRFFVAYYYPLSLRSLQASSGPVLAREKSWNQSSYLVDENTLFYPIDVNFNWDLKDPPFSYIGENPADASTVEPCYSFSFDLAKYLEEPDPIPFEEHLKLLELEAINHLESYNRHESSGDQGHEAKGNNIIPNDDHLSKGCKKTSSVKNIRTNVGVCKWLYIMLESREHKRVIEYTNREQRTFRINDQNKLAKMWGELKRKPLMTYDKLA